MYYKILRTRPKLPHREATLNATYFFNQKFERSYFLSVKIECLMGSPNIYICAAINKKLSVLKVKSVQSYLILRTLRYLRLDTPVMGGPHVGRHPGSFAPLDKSRDAAPAERSCLYFFRCVCTRTCLLCF